MDYTTNPRTNQRPDQSNFEFLAVMYGTVGSTLAPTEAATDNSIGWDSSGPAAIDAWWEDRRRHLRGAHQQTPGSEEEDGIATIPRSQHRALSQLTLDAYEAAMTDFDHPSWRMLHESDHGRALEMDLGDGFRLQAHMLKV
jgi:hypothetical protein